MNLLYAPEWRDKRRWIRDLILASRVERSTPIDKDVMKLGSYLKLIKDSLTPEEQKETAAAYTVFLRMQGKLPNGPSFNLIGPAIRWRIEYEFKEEPPSYTVLEKQYHLGVGTLPYDR